MAKVNFPKGWLQDHFDRNAVRFAEAELREAEIEYCNLMFKGLDINKRIKEAKERVDDAKKWLKKVQKEHK